ncbi:hypothetical protein [Shewanella litorisediminis]|uniref:O-antigen polymerase n=1 Tax=Shewanella litorisediminis TaxID=1173586 RepID=A0ABX7FZQ1_9GAMM|nr:hypothetical protein [Shewanella litorisediminis]MCL2919636.1 hypothetical protein [Shewanella litorisediminis]QRH00527.1 hypothetical protein JQC75_11590 [Shewanella litorisediminis]
MSPSAYIKSGIYVSFFIYVFLAFLDVPLNVPGFNYIVVSLLFFISLSGIVIFNTVNVKDIIFSIFALSLGIGGYFSATISVGALFPFFYLLLWAVMFSFIRKIKPEKQDIIDLLKNAFYFYLLVSIVSFILFKSHYRAFSFDGFFLDRAFHGVEGSPANIDTFCTVFFLAALMSDTYSLQQKIFHFIVFFLVVYFCGTTTPFLILLTVIGYLLIKYFIKLHARRTTVLGIYAVMLAMFYFSIHSEIIYQFLLLATNGRNYIWNEQIFNVFSNFSIQDLFFGNFSNAYVPIHWSSEDTNNPHNGYLFMLIRLGFVVTFGFFAYSLIVVEKISNFQFVILISLLAASVSNSNVFYLSNPIMTLVLVYSILPIQGAKHEKYSTLLR